MGMGRLLAGIAVFFWGAAYVWGKVTMEWLPPLETTTARFVLGAIIFLLLILFTKKPNKNSYKGHWLHYFLLGFIGITCFQALLFFALDVTSAINVAVIMALAPVFTAIAESFVSKEIPTIHTIIAILVSVSGATLAVLAADSHGNTHLSFNWGDIIAVISALCFSFYTVASRRWLPASIPSLINVTIVVSIGAILLLPLNIAFSSMPKSPTDMGPIWGLVGLVFGSTVIAYICWTKAIEQIGVSEPNLIFNFMPLVTMALSSINGAPPNTLQILGAVLVICGVTWAMLQKNNLIQKKKEGMV